MAALVSANADALVEALARRTDEVFGTTSASGAPPNSRAAKYCLNTLMSVFSATQPPLAAMVGRTTLKALTTTLLLRLVSVNWSVGYAQGKSGLVKQAASSTLPVPPATPFFLLCFLSCCPLVAPCSPPPCCTAQIPATPPYLHLPITNAGGRAAGRAARGRGAAQGAECADAQDP